MKYFEYDTYNHNSQVFWQEQSQRDLNYFLNYGFKIPWNSNENLTHEIEKNVFYETQLDSLLRKPQFLH